MAEPRLWEFALRCYSAPGVEKACIAIQDRHTGDVPLLLYCLWAGVCGRILSAADVARAAATAATLQVGVIQPLRHARRALRQVDEAPAAVSDQVTAVRERIKSVELEAERCELEWLETLDLGALSQDGDSAVSQNIMTYLAFLDVTPDQCGDSHLRSLIEGAHAAR